MDTMRMRRRMRRGLADICLGDSTDICPLLYLALLPYCALYDYFFLVWYAGVV